MTLIFPRGYIIARETFDVEALMRGKISGALTLLAASLCVSAFSGFGRHAEDGHAARGGSGGRGGT
ncbi:MAG TPA: hypothetical protein VM943_00680 [Pyrinomonadaceae bacterium]|nr:hypothetical protein [Pyrinomonadaceae bacterium]